jgi:hypothetical protein
MSTTLGSKLKDALGKKPTQSLSTMDKLKSMFAINLDWTDPPIIDQDQTKIDFKDLLKTHKARTEKSLPFTLQTVEDVLFVSKRKLLALEYIYY